MGGFREKLPFVSRFPSRAWQLGLLAPAATVTVALIVMFVVPGYAIREELPQLVLVETLGGDTIAFTVTRNAFGLPARNLIGEERRTFAVGNSFFRQNWVTAPASTAARDGLGPTFNGFPALPATLGTAGPNLLTARTTRNED